MLSLAENITLVCKNLIENPNNIKTTNTKDYLKALDAAKTNSAANREIVNKSGDCDFYVNVRNNICIRLYKSLSIDPSFNDIDDTAYKVLHEKDQVVKNWNWYHVAMKKWDINIKFNDSTISKTISENEFMQKSWAIIKWKDCFVQRSSPGWKDWEHYSLIATTKEELKVILKWLTELL